MIYGIAIYFGGVLSGLLAVILWSACAIGREADSEERHTDYEPRVMPKIWEGKP